MWLGTAVQRCIVEYVGWIDHRIVFQSTTDDAFHELHVRIHVKGGSRTRHSPGVCLPSGGGDLGDGKELPDSVIRKSQRRLCLYTYPSGAVGWQRFVLPIFPAIATPPRKAPALIDKPRIARTCTIVYQRKKFQHSINILLMFFR